jgi:hypothetical protein
MKAQDLCLTNEAKVDFVCDLWERKTLYKSIHQTREQVSLCTTCYKYINPMPDGIIKKSVERFLMKNVI